VILSGQKNSEFSDEDQTKISSRLQELLTEEKYKKFGDHYRASLEKISEQIQTKQEIL
jgi:hypothetical protein